MFVNRDLDRQAWPPASVIFSEHCTEKALNICQPLLRSLASLISCEVIQMWLVLVWSLSELPICQRCGSVLRYRKLFHNARRQQATLASYFPILES